MKKIKLNPMDYPLKEGESWWMVHPNDGKLVLKIPTGAPALSTENFLSFKKDKVYQITSVDDDQGWVTIENSEEVCEMPRYVFARYFDAVPFVKHSPGGLTRLNPAITYRFDENLFTDEE